MRMIAAMFVMLLMIGTANAVPTNSVDSPTCYPSYTALPIYRMDVVQLSPTGMSRARGTVFLGSRNFWITAAHVMYDGKAKTGQIYVGDKAYIEANLIYIDIKNDVAVLYADSGPITPLNLQTSVLTEHEPMWNLGYPGLSGYNNMVSFRGSLLSVPNQFETQLVTSALVLPGMSGGPTVRCSATGLEVVGVVSSYPVEHIRREQQLENGTTQIVVHSVNSGGGFSSPHMHQYISKAMEARIKQLDQYQRELDAIISN